jgi:Icc-related predicted phosphoesterase
MITICCISDTHSFHAQLEIPKCDLLIHAGDFSGWGKYEDVYFINKWFGELKEKEIAKEIILVAGNHDLWAEQYPGLMKEELTNCIYLNEESCEVFGYKIFGSPITPEFNNWAFNRKRGEEIARHWTKIPEGTEILISHGPPYGILDIDTEMIYSLPLGPEHLGCEELLKAVKKLKPRLHCFGHIHSSHGEMDIDGTKFINASVLDEQYNLVYKPTIIHLEK